MLHLCKAGSAAPVQSSAIRLRCLWAFALLSGSPGAVCWHFPVCAEAASKFSSWAETASCLHLGQNSRSGQCEYFSAWLLSLVFSNVPLFSHLFHPVALEFRISLEALQKDAVLSEDRRISSFVYFTCVPAGFCNFVNVKSPFRYWQAGLPTFSCICEMKACLLCANASASR